MTATRGRARRTKARPRRSARVRLVLLALAALRAALALVAIPLAPALYDDHFVLLVLLRPAKEVLLLAGYEILQGNERVDAVVLASLPLMVFAVWVFYLLGREHRDDLETADLPGVAGRLLPRARVRHLSAVLGERGWPLVLLGRLAVMPSSLVAAAAGVVDLPMRTFLLADSAGAVLSLGAMLFAGYALGETYEAAGPWFTAVGVVALGAAMFVLGTRLTRAGRRRGRSARAS